MMNGKRVISVTGTGRMSVKPDTAEITATVSVCDPDYEKAVALAGEKVSALVDAMEDAGFGGDAVSTVHWGVNARREGYQDGDGIYRERFAGYEVTQIIKLTVPSDENSTGAAVSAAAGCGAEPGLSVRFTVRDASRFTDRLLELAVSDARRKAETLARAAGASLGGILNVRCDAGEAEIYSETVLQDGAGFSAAPKRAAVCAALAASPGDIEKEAAVICRWELC